MDVYELSEKPGYCVIFNHLSYSESFPGGQPAQRKIATKEDIEAIQSTFNKLGFQSKVVEDGTKQEIFDTLKQVFSMDFSQFGSIFVFILTHGRLAKTSDQQLKDGRLELCARDQRYIFKDLFDEAMDSASPTLDGKPKVFIIQACSGSDLDVGITASSSDDHGESSQQHQSEIVEDAEAASDQRPLLLPDKADVLLAFASPPGYVSFRQRGQPWFIQTLCKSIDDYGQKYKIEKLLTLTRREVAKKKAPFEGENYKQIPIVISTLTKQLRLPSNVNNAAQ